jgi:hypothetical protein
MGYIFNRNKSAQRAWIAAILALSGIVLYAGALHFVHELLLIPGTPILSRLPDPATVTNEDLSGLERSRLEALKFLKTPRAYTELCSSFLIRARRAVEANERSVQAGRALEACTKSLQMESLNTFTWAKTTSAYMMLGPENASKAIKAWRASIITGRFEPSLFYGRIHQGIYLYEVMSEDDITMLKEQFLMAFQWNAVGLREYAEKNQLKAWMIFLSDHQIEKIRFFS